MNLKYLTCVCLNSRKMEGTNGLVYNVVSFVSFDRLFNRWLMASAVACLNFWRALEKLACCST